MDAEILTQLAVGSSLAVAVGGAWFGMNQHTKLREVRSHLTAHAAALRAEITTLRNERDAAESREKRTKDALNRATDALDAVDAEIGELRKFKAHHDAIRQRGVAAKKRRRAEARAAKPAAPAKTGAAKSNTKSGRAPSGARKGG